MGQGVLTARRGPNAADADGSGRSIVAVIGNPRFASRTTALARELAAAIGFRLNGFGPAKPRTEVIDLAPHARELVRPRVGRLQPAIDAAAGADVLLAVSPTHRAGYTGLLKLFLDRLPQRGLDGRVAVPVVVAVTMRQALTGNDHLRPVLWGLGASCPTDPLFVLESELPEPDRVVGQWLRHAAPILSRAVA